MRIASLLFAATLAGGFLVLPRMLGEEPPIGAQTALVPSSTALESLKALHATPLDRPRTTRLAERYQRVFAAAGIPVPTDGGRGFDATWIVASCWQPSVADARVASSDEDEVAAVRFFVRDPQGLAAAKSRVQIVSREYTVYSQAMAEAMAKAICPKDRVDAVMAVLKRACDRNRRIQEHMLTSPLLAQTIAKLTILTAPIAENIVEEEVPGTPEPQQPRPTWADRRLMALPPVLDLTVPPSTAAEILSLDADRIIMSLVAL